MSTSETAGSVAPVECFGLWGAAHPQFLCQILNTGRKVLGLKARPALCLSFGSQKPFRIDTVDRLLLHTGVRTAPVLSRRRFHHVLSVSVNTYY